MKRFMLPIVLALFILQAKSQQVTWTQLNSGVTQHLTDVFFINPSVGLVTGLDSTLLKTTDGGATWTQLPFPGINDFLGNNGDIQAIMFDTSLNIGFMAYRFMGDDPLATTDEGASWNEAVSLIQGGLCNPRGIISTGPAGGVMFGRGCFGGAFVSTFGGFGWSAPEMLYYGPQQTGVSGYSWDPVHLKNLVAVEEGVVLTGPLLQQAGMDTTLVDTLLSDIDYAGNGKAYLAGSDIYYPLLFTTDGGQTFQADSSWMPTFFYPQIHDLEFTHENFGFMACTANLYDGLLLTKTGNGFSYFSTSFPMRKVFAIDSNLAFAVGDSGQIYRMSWEGLNVNNAATVPSEWIAYPNPVQAGATIMVTGLEMGTPYQWVDVQGRILLQATAQDVQLKVPELVPGIYFLQQGKRFQKVIIQE